MQPYHTRARRGHDQSGHVPALPRARTRGAPPTSSRSIRPTDGRYGENPFRFQHYFQYQVILKPAPEDVLDLYFGSLEAVGIDLERSTTSGSSRTTGRARRSAPGGSAGRSGCDGMEVTQFTYFQQLGGLELDLVPAEITYGLERLAMFLQDKRQRLRARMGARRHLGRRLPRERAPVVGLQLRAGAGRHARCAASPSTRTECRALVGRGLPLPAYDQVLKCSHTFNLLDARGRDLGDRARRLHRPRPQARARRRRADRGSRCRRCCLRSGARSCPRPPAGRPRRSCASAGPERGGATSGRGAWP